MNQKGGTASWQCFPFCNIARMPCYHFLPPTTGEDKEDFTVKALFHFPKLNIHIYALNWMKTQGKCRKPKPIFLIAFWVIFHSYFSVLVPNVLSGLLVVHNLKLSYQCQWQHLHKNKRQSNKFCVFLFRARQKHNLARL